jgi:hypothetical protein
VIIMGTIKSDETREFAEYLRRMRTTTQENVDQTAEKHGRQLRYQAREIHAPAAHWEDLIMALTLAKINEGTKIIAPDRNGYVIESGKIIRVYWSDGLTSRETINTLAEFKIIEGR